MESDDDYSAFVSACYLHGLKKSRKRRRWYVRPTNISRPINSHFHSLLPDLRLQDSEMFFNYFRMSPERFDCLFQLIEPLILKRPTHKLPISAQERLAITIRYLPILI